MSNLTLRTLDLILLLCIILANWSSEWIWGNFTIFSSNSSLMKSSFILTFFVRSCWKWLCTISHVALLSQNIWIYCSYWKPKYCKRSFNYNASQITFVELLHYASTLKRAITLCFLILHVTILPPINVKYQEIDHMSPLLST